MLLNTSILLLATQVSAGALINKRVITRSEAIEESMRRYVDSIVEPLPSTHTLTRRQTPTMPTTGLNVTAWNAQTESACITSLESLNGVASNPSGMAVCYNLPYLDNSTGVFEADLRLYMISAPSGDFAGIESRNVQVGLAYNGATVSSVNASSLKRRADGGVTSLISWPRWVEEGGLEKRVTVPTLVQSYAFVGQVNKDLLAANMGTAALQKVLVPTVSLTGTESTGATVNTTLSSSEATFVSGVFAKVLTPTKSQVVPPIQTLVVASDAPFVVPGLNILIVPIGLIISSVWTVVFVGTVAWGTVGRMQFREQYRRRTAVAVKAGLSRI